MKKKIAIIGTNGLPAKYGGFETLADYLVKYLEEDFEITVYCSKTKKINRIKNYQGAKLVYLPFKANGWQSLIYDAVSIVHALFRSDALVILGFSGVLAFPLKVLFKRKIISNIGGIEWQKVRGKKSLAAIEVFVKKWFEKVCVRFSDVLVVDNQVLWDYVKNTYNIDSVLAEYGGDHATHEEATQSLIEKYPYLNSSYDVSISRAQEDMNIHVILEAYKLSPKRKLVVISNWGISDYGIELKRAYKNKYSNIVIQDAVYQLEELNAIRSNASLYLHTHSLCGTAPSLTEAMYLGLPTLCFDVATNRASTEGKSYYFKDSRSLLKILDNLDEVNSVILGNHMKEIADRRYYWSRIAGLYKEQLI